jgi:hypothetical protein
LAEATTRVERYMEKWTNLKEGVFHNDPTVHSSFPDVGKEELHSQVSDLQELLHCEEMNMKQS